MNIVIPTYNKHYQYNINFLDSFDLYCLDKKNDYVMLIVGEVDCRVHLPKQIQLQSRPIDEVIIECVDRFFRTYLDLKERGYNVIGWGGHPSTISGPSENPSEPIIGDCRFRNTISLKWDSYIESLFIENNIPHVSIIKDLIGIDGLTKMNYFMDYCHLKHDLVKEIIQTKFKEIGIYVY